MESIMNPESPARTKILPEHAVGEQRGRGRIAIGNLPASSGCAAGHGNVLYCKIAAFVIQQATDASAVYHHWLGSLRPCLSRRFVRAHDGEICVGHIQKALSRLIHEVVGGRR